MPEIRTNFGEPVAVAPEQQHWVGSPQAGVERVMLDRSGDEVAVATSLVRYAPGSTFPEHDHALGEEFVVLAGEFGDEHGRYGAGSYIRNPPGTHHAPFSEPGCLIWVKLRQFDLADQRQCVLLLDSAIPVAGWSERELHRFGDEIVREVVAAMGAEVVMPAVPEIQEVLVVEGELDWQGLVIGPTGWVRVPAGSEVRFDARSACRMLTKTRPFYRSAERG